ncbi:MAG: GyrI-like domain-containing protein [Bacteroidota bacterium]|nr:GyrI-like domain-containing protein [Bacteroidota bacterium]MDX5448357.1 GyrI-like domain-containing protein [Bacteroidota bacterium]
MISFNRLEEHPETRIAGLSNEMSFDQNKTTQLWQSFGPLIKEISGRIDQNLYSIEVYPKGFFDEFSPSKTFKKWAGVPISSDVQVPEPLNILILTKGNYAVFSYQGTPQDAAPAYRWIFSEWIPQSEWSLDDRPHLAIMGKDYRQNDSSSQEEIWIPVTQ